MLLEAFVYCSALLTHLVSCGFVYMILYMYIYTITCIKRCSFYVCTVHVDWGKNNPAFVIVFSQIGKFCYTYTFGAIYLIPPDLYPTNLRATGLGLCQVFGLMGYIAAPMFRIVVCLTLS